MIIFDIFNHFPEQFPIIQSALSAAVAYILGIVWYHPKISGDYHEQKNAENFKPNALIYTAGAGLWIITACVYSFLISFLTPPAMPALLGMSTFLWVGFVLPPILINGIFKGRALNVMELDSSYYLAAFYLFAVIHDVL